MDVATRPPGAALGLRILGYALLIPLPATAVALFFGTGTGVILLPGIIACVISIFVFRAARKVEGKPLYRLSDPWRLPRVLESITWAYLGWSIIPVSIAVLFSFNNGLSRSVWQGFSTGWYCGGAPAGTHFSLCQRPELTAAIIQTVMLAVITVLIATPLGVAFAIGIDRWKGRPARAANFGMLLSFVTPELIVAVALFLTFANLLRFIEMGTMAQAVGLVALQMSYPVIIVRARLSTIGKEYEEAAMDLGARPSQALRKVLLPLLYPAIFASGIIVFADVIDDFVLVRAVCQRAACETISMKIYSGYRSSPTPALNAMATIMLFGTFLAVGVGSVIYKRIARKQEGGKVDAISDFAMQI
ncbi:MAG: ABC transporter permease subunit [Actinomycetota bacterium]